MALLKSTLYRLVDTAFLGRGVPRTINGEPIRFAAQWCRYYPRWYQPATHSFLVSRCERGTTAIDVGAHLGLFTVAMARRVGSAGRVLSYEPTHDSFAALTSTVRLNSCEKVTCCYRQAVFSRSTPLDFFVTEDPVSAANSLVGAEERESIHVEAVRLDSLNVEPRVSVIKIDAEGAEVDVLEGAKRLIHAHKPAIALDVHPTAIDQGEWSLPELCSLMDDLRLVPHRASERVSSEWICRQRQIFDLQLVPG